jgi:nitroreductase
MEWRMELFEALESRTSAGRLAEPGPDSVQLQRILHAGSRAPDHGRLKPWRFVVMEGAAREAFTAAAAEAKRVRLPMTDEQLASERQKIARSPCVVVVGCAVNREQTKVPEIEQVAAVSAAVENMFLAAHDLGFGVMWKTGAAAYDVNVKATAGLAPDDHIVAILHMGTRVK